MVHGELKGCLSVKAAINLWDALVRSQLEYGAEILPKKAWKESEGVQMDFCRQSIALFINDK